MTLKQKIVDGVRDYFTGRDISRHYDSLIAIEEEKDLDSREVEFLKSMKRTVLFFTNYAPNTVDLAMLAIGAYELFKRDYDSALSAGIGLLSSEVALRIVGRQLERRSKRDKKEEREFAARDL